MNSFAIPANAKTVTVGGRLSRLRTHALVDQIVFRGKQQIFQND
jgi:hypothetical protein